MYSISVFPRKILLTKISLFCYAIIRYIIQSVLRNKVRFIHCYALSHNFCADLKVDAHEVQLRNTVFRFT